MDESSKYSDRENELKAFADTKLGVKGLVDSGIVNVPRIFARPPEEILKDYPQTSLHIPLIDFLGMENSDRRREIVRQVQQASERWGFFQVINHGIPLSVLEEMIDGVRLFHEQDMASKKQLFSYDPSQKVRFFSTYDLHRAKTANWGDTLLLAMQPSDPINADEIPESCRSAILKYLKHASELGYTISELLSEALGLKAEHLNKMECTKGYNSLGALYYPPCPEPELTNGVCKHTDISFFSILVQDHTGGLQVLHKDKWAEVKPIAGGLVINIGEMLQVASNDKFKSVIHRSLVNKVDARISAVLFFHGSPNHSVGPIEDLISEKYPAIYKCFQVNDFMKTIYTRHLSGEELRNFYRL